MNVQGKGTPAEGPLRAKVPGARNKIIVAGEEKVGETSRKGGT